MSEWFEFDEEHRVGARRWSARRTNAHGIRGVSPPVGHAANKALRRAGTPERKFAPRADIMW